MKVYNAIHDFENNSEESQNDIAYYSLNFNKIPPIIGIIIANKHGNTLMVLEYNNNTENNYGAIKSYLSDDDKNLLELDLIPMYFSSFKTFAGQTNIQNLSNLEIHGSNIKVQIYFLFDKFMVIIFLNSKVDLNIKEKTQLVEYFEDKLMKYEFEFTHFPASHSRKIIRMLENKGKVWLKILNKTYLQTYENAFLKKHELIDVVMNKIAPVIQKELSEYLEGIPEDILNNVSKEIKNKIQDKICEFNLKLF